MAHFDKSFVNLLYVKISGNCFTRTADLFLTFCAKTENSAKKKQLPKVNMWTNVHYIMLESIFKWIVKWQKPHWFTEWQIGHTQLDRRAGLVLAFIVGFVNVFDGAHHLFPCLQMSLCNWECKKCITCTTFNVQNSTCSWFVPSRFVVRFQINHWNVHFHLKFKRNSLISFSFNFKRNVRMRISGFNFCCCSSIFLSL